MLQNMQTWRAGKVPDLTAIAFGTERKLRSRHGEIISISFPLLVFATDTCVEFRIHSEIIIYIQYSTTDYTENNDTIIDRDSMG